MTTTSPRFGLTIPAADGSDDADLAALLRALGLDAENLMPGITALTTAARTALTGAAMFNGRAVYDTDLYTLFLGDGTTWRALARLDTSGHLPMAGKKVTGLAAGTANGDAVTKGQLDTVSGVANAAAVKANNLSDLASAATARTNLGLGTAATTLATDYATAAQGTTADAALPRAGGVMSGTLQFESPSDKVMGPYPEAGDLNIHTPTGQVVLQGPAGTPASGQIAHANATFANQSATLGQIPSSRTVKTDIAGLTAEQVERFDAIQPVAFRYQPGQAANEVEQAGVHFGFIAEDVKAAGLRVLEDPDGTVFGLQPFELIAVLWAKVQQLAERIADPPPGK